MVRYKTVYERGEDFFEEKKSEFIGHVSPCKTEDEALEFIEEIRDKYKDATHNCYGYIIGEKSLIQRFSDDGEPQGTAGIPILEVLKKENLTNLCCVVTRYFGGKKLGASGLIRAYTRGASISLDKAVIVDIKDYHRVKIVIDYSVLGSFDNFLSSSNFVEYDREYSDVVSIFVYVDKEEYNSLQTSLMDMTSGSVQIEILENLLMPTKNGILYRR